jgi:transcription termination/antitermination protein NusA
MAAERGANKNANLGEEIHKLDATTDEELDALEVNLRQEDERPNSRDGSGRVVDELAEEKVGKFTEVGPLQEDRGAVSVMPGRDNTSETLRQHHPNTALARAQDVVEGNLDEPRDDAIVESKRDEGTAG